MTLSKAAATSISARLGDRFTSEDGGLGGAGIFAPRGWHLALSLQALPFAQDESVLLQTPGRRPPCPAPSPAVRTPAALGGGAEAGGAPAPGCAQGGTL